MLCLLPRFRRPWFRNRCACCVLAVLWCCADANPGGRARGERMEASARRRLPPAVFQPHAAVHHVRYRHPGAGYDAVDHHLRVNGLPQPRQ